MRRFWFRLIIYVLPFAIGFLTLTGALIYVGESMPLGMVLAHQSGDEFVLFRYRYGNRDQQYKLLAANQRQADVLAIGSSRVLQFRAGFADRDPDAFYNASGPAWTLDEVQNLLYHMKPDALPEILLLGLDFPWYNAAYVGDTFPEPVSDFDNLFLINRAFLQDFIEGDRINIERFLARVEPGSGDSLALGLRAIHDGHGFRNDGSEQFGDYLVAGYLWQPQQRERHLQLMQNCEYVYPCGTQITNQRVEQTREILQWAAEHDILVVGFLPSYAPTLWDEMSTMPQHAYIEQAQSALSALFAEFNFPFFDYSDGASIGLTDEDFFDGWHASERGNLALYIQLVRYVPELAVYSDVDALQARFDQADNTWQVFPNTATNP